MNGAKKVILTTIFGLALNLSLQSQNKIDYKNQPAILKDFKSGEITLDFLKINPKFAPGITDYFINKSKKTRIFKLSENLKYYECNGQTKANTLGSISTIEKRFERDKKEKTENSYYFEIKNNEIISIYEQCLP